MVDKFNAVKPNCFSRRVLEAHLLTSLPTKRLNRERTRL